MAFKPKPLRQLDEIKKKLAKYPPLGEKNPRLNTLFEERKRLYGMAQTVRIAALCVFCLLGFTACGFFGEEHSEIPASKRAAAQVRPPGVSSYPSTAEQWVNLSRTLYQEGKYLESIGASQTALHLKPEFAEAFNNIGAAYAAMRLWDLAIQADQQAVRLQPTMQLARNNLAWALQQKSLEKR